MGEADLHANLKQFFSIKTKGKQRITQDKVITCSGQLPQDPTTLLGLIT